IGILCVYGRRRLHHHRRLPRGGAYRRRRGAAGRTRARCAGRGCGISARRTGAASAVIEYNPVLFAEVARVNPGLVSTLSVLGGHLRNGPLPPPEVLHAYGQHICRLGAAITGYADQLANESAIEVHSVGGPPEAPTEEG